MVYRAAELGRATANAILAELHVPVGVIHQGIGYQRMVLVIDPVNMLLGSLDCTAHLPFRTDALPPPRHPHQSCASTSAVSTSTTYQCSSFMEIYSQRSLGARELFRVGA